MKLEKALENAPRLLKRLKKQYGENIKVEKRTRMGGNIKNALSSVEVLDYKIYVNKKQVGVYTEHWLYTGFGADLKQEYNGKRIKEDEEE